MEGSNNFKQFDSDKANMLTDDAYLASTYRTGGAISGLAPSNAHNKLFYQLSTMVAALAAMLAGKDYNAVDTDLATLTTTLEAIQTLADITADITVGDVTSGHHGYAPKLSNVATEYLDGKGLYSVPEPPGSIIQVVPTLNQTVTTGTTTVTNDASAYTSSKGNNAGLDTAITPRGAGNDLLITGVVTFSFSANAGTYYAGLFRDSGVNALAVFAHPSTQAADIMQTMPFMFKVAAGATSATTFKLRVGNNSGGTLTFNDQAAQGVFAGKVTSMMIIQEIKV